MVCREILEDLELELGPDGDEDEEQELDLNALKEEVFLKLLVTGKFELFSENGFIKIFFLCRCLVTSVLGRPPSSESTRGKNWTKEGSSNSSRIPAAATTTRSPPERLSA